MSFNVKHYLAVGLGVAVFAGFVMQRSASDKPVAFESQASEFKPLSSFEIAPANSLTGIENQSTAQSVGLNTEDSLNNDFAIPEFVNDSELEFADSAAEASDGPAESMDQMEIVSAFVLAESETEVVQEDVRHSDLPNSRWKANPFALEMSSADEELAINMDETQPSELDDAQNSETEQLVVEAVQTSELDAPVSLASDGEREIDSTIIIEPTLDDTVPEEMVKTVSDEQTYQPTRDDHTNGDFVIDPAIDAAQFDFDSEDSEIGGLVETTDLDTGNQAVEVAPWQLGLSESVAQQAVHHIEYGKSLSRRGAAFAARQEFYSALRIIAQANDASTGSNVYSQALSQAVKAMKEAQDFVFSDVEAEMILNVASITETHLSNVISAKESETISSAQAMQRYFAFAQNKLDEASGRNVVSAEALYCLGKLHTVVAKTSTIPNRFDVAKAMTYHRAALTSDSNNYRSANELGVLLVRSGQLEQATELFKQSLITRATPQTWQNLAKTHRRMGQRNLARLAESESTALVQSQTTSPASTIRWVPAKSFNEQAPMEFYDNKRVATRPEEATKVSESETTKSKEPSKLKTFGERLKKLF